MYGKALLLLAVAQGREEHDLLRQPGAGGEEGGEAAGGFEFVDATEGGDHVPWPSADLRSPMSALFAAVLDDLQIAAGV